MEDEFVTFEIALILKAKGFDKPCFTWFSNDGMLGNNYYGCNYNKLGISAPLWQQLIKWLKAKNVLVAETWYGWEVIKKNISSKFFEDKLDAFNYALTLI